MEDVLGLIGGTVAVVLVSVAGVGVAAIATYSCKPTSRRSRSPADTAGPAAEHRAYRADSTSCWSAATPVRARAASARARADGRRAQRRHHAACTSRRTRRAPRWSASRATWSCRSRRARTAAPATGSADQQRPRPTAAWPAPCSTVQNLTGLDDPVRRPDHLQRASSRCRMRSAASTSASRGRSATRTPALVISTPARYTLQGRDALAVPAQSATASATAATSAGSARSRSSCRRSCARSRADDTLTELRQALRRSRRRRPRTSRCRENFTHLDTLVSVALVLKNIPLENIVLRAVPGHDRRGAEQGRADPLPREPAVRVPEGRQAFRVGQQFARPAITRAQSSARHPSRVATPDADTDPDIHQDPQAGQDQDPDGNADPDGRGTGAAIPCSQGSRVRPPRSTAARSRTSTSRRRFRHPACVFAPSVRVQTGTLGASTHTRRPGRISLGIRL